MDLLNMTFALVLSAVLGGVVGYERQTHEHPAGLRTYMLVCVGSTLMTIVSTSFAGDRTRIAAQIVSGIGFLGAGTILHRGNVVQGLTTAAGLWVVAGIGMLIGAHGVSSEYTVLAIIATGFVFAVLSIMRKVDARMRLSSGVRELQIEVAEAHPQVLADVLHGLLELGITIKSLRTAVPSEKQRRAFVLVLGLPNVSSSEAAVRFLMSQDGLESVHWE